MSSPPTGPHQPSAPSERRPAAPDLGVRLRDGTVATIRPMADDDGERLVRFHATLSPETQYRRFFSSHARLSESEVTWFTHVDHLRRDAFVAVVEEEIAGVGRLDRLDDEGDAEVAFVVADRLQGLGLGGALLRTVIARAVELGVARLVAETLWQNDAMLAVFRHSGVPMATRVSDGTVHVTMDLTAHGR